MKPAPPAPGWSPRSVKALGVRRKRQYGRLTSWTPRERRHRRSHGGHKFARQHKLYARGNQECGRWGGTAHPHVWTDGGGARTARVRRAPDSRPGDRVCTLVGGYLTGRCAPPCPASLRGVPENVSTLALQLAPRPRPHRPSSRGRSVAIYPSIHPPKYCGSPPGGAPGHLGRCPRSASSRRCSCSRRCRSAQHALWLRRRRPAVEIHRGCALT
jgi:hypothetical protein